MVWSSKLMLKIWVRSNKWLLRYFTFEVVFSQRFSSFKDWKMCFVHLSLSLKFDFDPNILQFLLFLGSVPLEVVFIIRICKIFCGHLSLSLKFEYDPLSGLRLARFSVKLKIQNKAECGNKIQICSAWLEFELNQWGGWRHNWRGGKSLRYFMFQGI